MSAARKILFFYQSPEIGGGVDTVLINLIKTWPDKNDQLAVWLNKDHKGKHLYDILGIDVKQMDLSASSDLKLISFLRPPYFLYSILAFYFKIRKHKPDVIFSHNGGYPGGELSLACVVAAKLVRVKEIFLVIHNYAIPLKGSLKFLNQFLDKLIEFSCTKILSVSASCANQIHQTRFPDSKKVGFVYNGIIAEKNSKLSLSSKRQELNLNGNVKVIGSIGDYEERKGHEYLIRAFEKIQKDNPDLKLVIIGSKSSSHTKVLEGLIQELHLQEKVLLTGYLDSAWEYIECFDIFIFPSIAYESFGMVLLEAMLYKKPIIATNAGGIPEVLGDTGVIVDPKDSQQIANAIKQILGNKDLSQQMQEKGYDRLKNEFQAGRMAQKYFDLISL